MTDNTILIIPDIHERVSKLEYILKKYNHIKSKICLGDWYDTHDYTSLSDKENIARAHADFVSNPENICLFGNHDMQYAFPKCYSFGCSGFEAFKQSIIDRWMTREKWDKVNLFHWITRNKKEILITHAGFHPCWAHHDLGLNPEYVTEICGEALYKAKYENIVNPIFLAGTRRGGNHPFGGCTWLDWRDFKPVSNLNQIVGHSFTWEVRIKMGENSENYCIDTGLEHVAIIDGNGTITIEEVYDL